MRAFWITVGSAILLLVGYFGYKALHKSGEKSVSASAAAEHTAYFDQLSRENFKLVGQEKLNVDELIALIPENISISYADSAFDAGTGATMMNDVKITMSENSDMGISIDQLSFWGVDENAIIDRVAGRRLQETIPVAQRIEAENISMFGLGEFLQKISDTTNEFAVDMVENIGDDGDVDVDITEAMPVQTFDKFDFSIGHSVATDITVHPWVLELTDLGTIVADDPGSQKNVQATELWHLVQKFAAWSYALSYENYASYDVDFNMGFSQDDMPFTMTMSYDLMGYQNIHRGDTGFGIVKGSNSLSNMAIPIENKDTNFQTMKMESFTEFYTMENVRMSGVLSHVARGKFPDRSDVDLMSFGVFRSGPSWSKFNDIKLFSVESAYFDLSEFHWLIPEVIDIGAENISINIGGFIDYMETTIGMAGEDVDLEMTEEQKQIAAESIKILEKYDLSEPVMDFAMAAHWSAETGDFDMGYNFDIDDFFAYDVRTDAVLPDYTTLMSSIPEDFKNMDGEAFVKSFVKNSAFKKYKIVANDKGGLEKGFAMAVDFAQFMPEDDPAAARLRNTTPEILRNMATNAFILPMTQVDKVFPPGVAYLQSVSDFIGTGGELSISIEPEKPLYFEDMEALTKSLQSNPDAIEKALGIQVVHTPAQ